MRISAAILALALYLNILSPVTFTFYSSDKQPSIAVLDVCNSASPHRLSADTPFMAETRCECPTTMQTFDFLKPEHRPYLLLLAFSKVRPPEA